jgi:DNA transformation protein
MTGDQTELILERLSRVTDVRARKMFGGVGLYSGELFFALVAHDVLYLKVDDRNRGDFEARGMAPFQPFPDKPSMLAYYELPADVLADKRRLAAWVEKSLEAARASAVKKSAAKRRGRAGAAAPKKLLNLGPVSRRMLKEIGVENRADLERIGSVAAFRAIEKRARKPANVLLLYALEGALLDLRWDRLPDVVKQDLRRRAGRR